MKRLAALLAFLPLAAAAQYSGPAVQACQVYAEQQIRSESEHVRSVVLDDDPARNIERYTRKLGSQFVSSVLYGNGAMVSTQGQTLEFTFLCLLADDKRAVFFHWLPRRDAPALTQCRRGGAERLSSCLQTLLEIAEQDLTQAYMQRFVEARTAEGAADPEAATNAFRRSAETWRAYRDAECARRPEGDARKACLVELTRRRLLDLQ
jgi:uncharacterized protein YecT (DUF1311 family)